MREQAYWIDQNGIQQSQWVHHDSDSQHVKKWIARNGSGQGFVSYSLILCCVSVAAAVLYGVFVGAFNGLLINIISSIPQ